VLENNNGRGEDPEDPTGILNEQVMSVLDSMTVQLNEVYESLKRAGFTPPEAITMVTGMLSTMIQYTPVGDLLGNNDNYNNDEDDDDDWNGPQDLH
jgi:hypothetical protein